MYPLFTRLRPTLSAAALCSLLAGCHSSNAPAVSVSPASHPVLHRPTIARGFHWPALHITAKDVPNFHMVTQTLLRGGAPDWKGLEELKAAGVKTVVDLRIAPKHVHAERLQVEKLGMHSVNLAMSGNPPTARQIATFLRLTQSPGAQRVYVHCQHGADRTGCMVGIYREKFQGWSYARAFAEMRKYGFNPHWTGLSGTVRKFAPKQVKK